MNDVEKKLMDEFANTTLQSAFQHSDFAAQGYEDKSRILLQSSQSNGASSG